MGNAWLAYMDASDWFLMIGGFSVALLITAKGFEREWRRQNARRRGRLPVVPPSHPIHPRTAYRQAYRDQAAIEAAAAGRRAARADWERASRA